MSEIFIETPRLILRHWQGSDHDPFIKLNKDAVVAEFFPSAFTAEETLAQIERFTRHIDDHGYGLFAVERKDNGNFIGFTGLSQPRFESWFTPCIEVGWRLSKANWNLGFATEAAKACLKFGFEKLGADKIYSFTAATNLRSEKVMHKIGMAKVGNFDHPSLTDAHVLKPHVLYRIDNPNS